ncbi:MAG TPA: hypothetical protein VK277_03725 [Acidimicrobiales bacterium]|nr:hypothetical protein [Acidimicrobiales bacterium]
MSDVTRQKKQERLIQMLRAQARSYRAHIASLEGQLTELRGGGRPVSNPAGTNTELENRLAAAGAGGGSGASSAEPRRGFPIPDMTLRPEPRKQNDPKLDQLLSAIGDS